LYINAIIDEKKINIYRTQFQLNIDECMNETILGVEDSRYFKFYHMLLNINTPAIIDEEYNILINEIQNFDEILSNSNLTTEEELKNYYEFGILLPLCVYLNKVFSFISRFKGPDLLKIYSLTCNTLLMMKLYSNKMLLIKVSNSHNDKGETVIQNKLEDINKIDNSQKLKLKAKPKKRVVSK
jgi:hypothetical protein